MPQHEDEEYFSETATLNLTRVPLPKSAYLGPIELIVPMRAKPKIAVVLLGQFDQEGSLGIKHCSAQLRDVLITVYDRSRHANREHGDKPIFQLKGGSTMAEYSSSKRGEKGHVYDGTGSHGEGPFW